MWALLFLVSFSPGIIGGLRVLVDVRNVVPIPAGVSVYLLPSGGRSLLFNVR